MTNLIESFTIPIYEWKTVDAGQKTIRIKGVAMRGDVVSKNNRKYTREALMKATNTWIGKPINVNHDNTKNIGNIKWMDYDLGSDALLYEAEINREPYVTLLRNRSTEIRGLSIQADYLHAICSRCGKKFVTEEDWYNHVTQEEFMKDLPTEPHGIIGSAISLVLSPEIPGYSGTTYELAEMARRETLRLLETVITEKIEEEKYKMSKIALNKETGNIAVGKSGIKGLTEKASEQKQEPEKKAEEKAEERKTEALQPQTVTLKESKLVGINEITATKLSLGEPFAGYADFAACVKANQDKDNPEAYCGKIKHEAEEILTLKGNVHQLTEKLNELLAEVNKPVTLTLPEVKIPPDDLSWKEIKPYDDSAIKEQIANIKPYDDTPLKAKLDEVTQKLPKLEETIAQQKKDFDNLLDSADKSVKEYFAANKKEMESDKAKITGLEEKLKQAEDKKLEETETLTNRVENLEDKLQPQFKSIAQKTDKEKKQSPDLTYKPGAK